MSPKPFSEVVETKTKSAEALKPFIDEAVGGTEFKEDSAIDTQKIGLFQKTINFFSSLQGLLTISTLFILVALIIDAIHTLQELLTSNSVLDTLYLIVLTILLISLLGVTFKIISQIRVLKDAKTEQDFFVKQRENPDKKLILATLNLLKSYELHLDEKVRSSAQSLQESIKSSHEYRTIYQELDEKLLKSIDKLAEAKIKSASIEAALSTAISPLALLDVLILVWRSFLLTKEIAQLYGFKPGWIATLALLKQGSFNIFFAGAVELASEYANEAAGHSLSAKISTSAGQGMANGILLARVGYGVMKACRPLPLQSKRSSFIKGIYSSIKELIFSTNSNTLQ